MAWSLASSRCCSSKRTGAPLSKGFAPVSRSWATVRCAASCKRRARPVLGRLRDAELDATYAGALCLACVSREEGFGFTPLEAAAAGVPVVVSDIPVFRETLGHAALMVPPDDAEAPAHALLRLEREPELAREPRGGRARARRAGVVGARGAETRAIFEEALG